jgi:hypothetical protein
MRWAWLVAVLAGCYQVTVQVTWPKEPMRVIVVHQQEGVPQPDAATAAEPDMARPQSVAQAKPYAGQPMLLAARGTLVFVEWSGGSDGTTLLVYEAASCQLGEHKSLWELGKGRRWDAQQQVSSGKVLCAETREGYGDGEVRWMVR